MLISRLTPAVFDLVVMFLPLWSIVRIGECSVASRRQLAAHPFRHCRPAAPPRRLWRTCSASGLALMWKLYGAYMPVVGCRWPFVMAACENGHLEKLRWLADQGLIGAPDLLHGASASITALNTACGRGRLAVAQWLVARFGCVADDFAFAWACEAGHLETAQWLVAQFGLRPQLGHIMPTVCARGHAAVAAWLIARFADPSWYPRLYYLNIACEKGHLEVVRVLATLDGFDSERTAKLRELRTSQHRRARRIVAKLRRSDNADRFTALALACRNEHLEIARMLTATWSLTARDDPSNHVHTMLCVACTDGLLEVAVWIADAFAVTPAMAAANNNYAIRYASYNQHEAIVEWLTARFGVTL